MKFSQVIVPLLIVLFIGCITNNYNSRPEFIEDLYQREQLPDSVGLEARIEIRKAQNDSIYFEFFIANEKETDQVIIHSGSFASIFIYKDSKLIYPHFDPNKMIYTDDYNESVIPAGEQIQILKQVFKRVPEFTGAKALGFAPLKIKPKYLKGLGPHSTVNPKEYWLLTPL